MANVDPLKVFDNPTILNEVRLKEELAKFNIPFPADSKHSVCPCPRTAGQHLLLADS
jgi:hypothetical protein